MTAAVLREVRLHGMLGQKFGRVHRLAVASVGEAVEALRVVCPGFERHLMVHSEPGYHVFVDHRSLDIDDLGHPLGSKEVIRIVPVVAGSKRAGIFSVVLGAALLMIAPYAAGALFASGTALGTAAAVGVATYGASIGKALILGGVIQLLSPQRMGRDAQIAENLPSYAFNGPVNTMVEGGRVPLAYGRVICGSLVVSAGVSTDDISPPPPAPPPPPPQLPIEQPLYPEFGA